MSELSEAQRALIAGVSTAPGSDTYVTFNDGGIFGGDSGLVFNKTTDLLTVGGGLSAGAAKFTVSSAGDITKINNVTTTWPAANASGVLTNNGSGTLSWAAASTITGSGSANQVTYWSSSSALTSGAGLTYDGTSLGVGAGTPAAIFHAFNTSTSTVRGAIFGQYNTNTESSNLTLRKARGTSTVPIIVVNGDGLGSIYSEAYDGAAYLQTASVRFVSNGTVATSSVPTDVVIYTGVTGGGTARVNVTSAGLVGINTLTNTVQGTLHVRRGSGTAPTAVSDSNAVMVLDNPAGNAVNLFLNNRSDQDGSAIWFGTNAGNDVALSWARSAGHFEVLSSGVSVGSGKFRIAPTTGNISRIRDVAYTWPSADAAGVLTSNGSGTLSWTAPAVTGAGATNRIAYWSAASVLTSTNGFSFVSCNITLPQHISMQSGNGIYFNDVSDAAWRIGKSLGAYTVSLVSTTNIGIATGNSGTEGFCVGPASGSSWFEVNSTSGYFRSKLTIGSTTTTSVLNVGTSGAFQVSTGGDIVKLNNITTSFPSSNSAGLLMNNGSGTYSIGGTGATNRVAYWTSTTAMTTSANLTYDGTSLVLAGDLSVGAAKFLVNASGAITKINNVAQQASGANLTNSVTIGGTDDTIADFGDLSVYATDAAAIRNNIYQLARKLKQVNDALRLYGLLS